jgi:hypothetical protein
VASAEAEAATETIAMSKKIWRLNNGLLAARNGFFNAHLRIHPPLKGL